MTITNYWVIKDINTDQYYWRYRIDDGWNRNSDDAEKFNTKEECIEFIKQGDYGEGFEGKTLTFVELYKIEDED